jgi:hypothetical protein
MISKECVMSALWNTLLELFISCGLWALCRSSTEYKRRLFLVFVRLEARIYLRPTCLQNTVLSSLIHFARRFTLTQMRVLILLILMSVLWDTAPASGYDAYTDVNILLSVRQRTSSPCVYLLYNGEQGTLYRMPHNQKHRLRGAGCFFKIE